MKIVLIGNYAPDAQQSMLRFVGCLAQELGARGIAAEVLVPPVRMARFVRQADGLGKWLGYVDKFVLFPRTLRRCATRAEPGTLFHLCDHSNAMYLKHLSPRRHLVTCHDLLAVRGALGDREAYAMPSRPGRVLQRWIRTSLGQAKAVVCDSQATAGDFRRLIPDFLGRVSIQLLGLNTPYRAIGRTEAWPRLAGLSLRPDHPFVLHVGSSHPRKNREGTIRIFHRLGSRFDGPLVFAGKSLSPEHRALADSLGLASRVVELGEVSDAEMEALYAAAHALLFPSKAEGFGWPVLEAQACGCPVVCSDRTSIPEVAGEAALIHDVADEGGMADSLAGLLDPAVRDALRKKGFANANRLTTGRMMDGYLALYREILDGA